MLLTVYRLSWVLGSPASETTGDGSGRFDSTKSPTFRAMAGNTLSVLYGDGSRASAPMSNDTFTVSGSTILQAFGVVDADGYKGPLTGTGATGLVGLGTKAGSSATPNILPTFVETILASMSNSVMTLYLPPAGAQGLLGFGAIDASKGTAPLTYVSAITDFGTWLVRPTALSLGNSPVAQTAVALIGA